MEINTKHVLKPSLYYGCAGTLFLDAISNEKMNFEVFDQSLSEIDNTDYSFSRGITGIGWVIQFLIENDKLSVDYNYLLGSFDDLIYKDVVNKKSFALSMFSKGSLLAKALYLFQRITSSRNRISFYNNIACKECLILLMSEMSSVTFTIIESNKTSKTLNTYATCFLEIGQVFLFFYFCLRANISKDFVCDRLRFFRIEIENILAEKNIEINNENASYLFYLLYIYTHVAIDIRDSSMVNSSHLFCNKLIPVLQLFWKDITDFKLKERLEHKMGVFNKVTANYDLLDKKADDSFYLWNKLGDFLSQQYLENKMETPLLRTFLLE